MIFPLFPRSWHFKVKGLGTCSMFCTELQWTLWIRTLVSFSSGKFFLHISWKLPPLSWIFSLSFELLVRFWTSWSNPFLKNSFSPIFHCFSFLNLTTYSKNTLIFKTLVMIFIISKIVSCPLFFYFFYHGKYT